MIPNEIDVIKQWNSNTYQTRFRPLKVQDAEKTLAWRNSNRARFLNPSSVDIDGQERWISSRPSDELNFIILDKNEVDVGMISLVNIDINNSNAEAGRFLLGEVELTQGSSIAIEAMLTLYQIAFHLLGLRRVYGFVSEKNNLMLKFHNYLGMKVEGRMREHYRYGEEFVDALILGLLHDEFDKYLKPKATQLLKLMREKEG